MRNVVASLGSVGAVIFDMDGVLVDSEHHWSHVEVEYLSSVSAAWNAEEYPSLTGMTNHDIYTSLRSRFGVEVDEMAFRSAFDRMAHSVYTKRVRLSEGLIEVLTVLQSVGLPCAIGSSSPRQWIDLVLDRFSLRSHFVSVTSGEEMAPGRGKPEPDLYLLAAERLSVQPRDCVAIEDSTNGVLSAKRAGMYCLGFRNEENVDTDLSGSDYVLERGFLSLLPLLRDLVPRT